MTTPREPAVYILIDAGSTPHKQMGLTLSSPQCPTGQLRTPNVWENTADLRAESYRAHSRLSADQGGGCGEEQNCLRRSGAALTREAIEHVSPENWRKACDHLNREEHDYWRADGLVDELIRALVIDFGEENESDFKDGVDSSSAVNSDLEV